MRAIDGEAERRPVCPRVDPGLDDVGDQRRLVHRLGQIALVVVAGDGADAGQVGRCRREHPERRQVAGLDQLLCCRADDQLVEMLAEAARPRRRRQADERHVRPCGAAQPFAVELEPAMHFVDRCTQIGAGISRRCSVCTEAI